MKRINRTNNTFDPAPRCVICKGFGSKGSANCYGIQFGEFDDSELFICDVCIEEAWRLIENDR